jgi:hypothetical protein
MLAKALLFFHVLFYISIGFLGAQEVDEAFLLQKPMLTNTHLSVLGCRFVALQFDFMSALYVFLGNTPLCLLPTVEVFSNLALLFLGRHLLIPKTQLRHFTVNWQGYDPSVVFPY